MLFILEHRKSNKHFEQLGFVAVEDKGAYASEVEAAAAKIGLKVVHTVMPPESAVIYAQLEKDYHLTEMSEIRGPEDIPTSS